MGSDGFESKRLGGLGPAELSGARAHDRQVQPDSIADMGEVAAANLIEISGVIKWFDASKGYGFIVPDNGAPDVLLHVTVLRRDGFQTAYEGARLVCEVLQRPKGYQAFRIVSMDESTAILRRCCRREPMCRSRRPAASSGLRLNGSTVCAASAS